MNIHYLLFPLRNVQLFNSYISESEHDIRMVDTSFGYRLYHATESVQLETVYGDHRYPFCDIFIMSPNKR